MERLIESELVKEQLLQEPLQEAHELLAITVTSIKTAKSCR